MLNLKTTHKRCLEECKPDSVCDGHLSLVSCETSPAQMRGALYPGLGEQRRRPCLRLQQAGVTAFHPAPVGAGYVSVALSIRPCDRPAPACAGHLALRCLDFPLRLAPERPSFLQALEYIATHRPQAHEHDTQRQR